MCVLRKVQHVSDLQLFLSPLVNFSDCLDNNAYDRLPPPPACARTPVSGRRRGQASCETLAQLRAAQARDDVALKPPSTHRGKARLGSAPRAPSLASPAAVVAIAANGGGGAKSDCQRAFVCRRRPRPSEAPPPAWSAQSGRRAEGAGLRARRLLGSVCRILPAKAGGSV